MAQLIGMQNHSKRQIAILEQLPKARVIPFVIPRDANGGEFHAADYSAFDISCGGYGSSQVGCKDEIANQGDICKIAPAANSSAWIASTLGSPDRTGVWKVSRFLLRQVWIRKP
jgi:hypothetical protein